jgi:hypothetical protein
MKQNVLYEPIRTWLEGRGFKALVTGSKTTIVIPINELVPMPYKIPDLIGVRNQRVVIVEVEKDKKNFFNAFGRCLLWRCFATFVYLAYPKGKVSRAPVLNQFGVGLLEVDINSQTVKELINLPQEESELIRVWELHPTEFQRELQLAEQIRKSLE